MISYIDEALQLWADERRAGDNDAVSLGCNVIASLMASQGVLYRGSPGSRVLLDRAAEIEWIVGKHLSPELRQVVIEQYCAGSLPSHKWSACGCSRSQFYRRLGKAHTIIHSQLLKRAA
ncbi:hypothetical protein SAMN05216588_12444 [Pseudomonas flavescens]|uniref:Phage antitermination protein Q n=1 Tax=Phytopseudomonas flavescens TaxID=29435 RepID=A0A1G8NA32_9GAMM|nr:hypothetical protein [Pseudomonas flavescens]SDI77159.1 hypothetical protein SAMN05216588_12444 [Pseudomonas flavescens]